MCGVSTKDEVCSDTLLSVLGLDDLEQLLRGRRFRWFGHVERNDGPINQVLEVSAECMRGRGRLKKTWVEAVRNDRKPNGLEQIDPGDRQIWKGMRRSSVRQDPHASCTINSVLCHQIN